jgi:putative hydrolase of the HAD superfamily
MTFDHAVIFDLDDTLYPEKSFALSGFRAIADQFADRIEVDFDLYDRMCALFDTADRAHIFDRLLADAGRPDDDELLTAMIQIYRTHVPRIVLYPDADAALARLHGRAGLGIITDGWLQAQLGKFQALGLHDRIDVFIPTDQWGREFWKPHPRAFEEMARRLDVPHGNCTYVADNPAKDFVAPNALGWRTIRILRDDSVYRDVPPPSGGEPQTTITTLDDI